MRCSFNIANVKHDLAAAGCCCLFPANNAGFSELDESTVRANEPNKLVLFREH